MKLGAHFREFPYTAALVLVGWYLMAQPAMAMNCEKDSLSDVSGSGAFLEMRSGQTYRVDDVDQVDSALWLAAEDVLICTKSVVYKGKQLTLYTIINKDESGEEVSAERLK
jgi:hypothetical protein